MNYSSKILVEPFLCEEKMQPSREIEVYCFNGVVKIIKDVQNEEPNKISMYDENLNNIDFKFLDKEILVKRKADDLINQTFDKISMKEILVLSEQLAIDFKFVRVDWIVSNNKLYFNELTFTPNSGLVPFDKHWNKLLGSYIRI